MRRSAFTLIEMLVVLSIIALIASVVSPMGFKMLNSVERFIETKKSDLELEKLKMLSFAKQKNATLSDGKAVWEDESTYSLAVDIQGDITSKGIWISK